MEVDRAVRPTVGGGARRTARVPSRGRWIAVACLRSTTEPVGARFGQAGRGVPPLDAPGDLDRLQAARRLALSSAPAQNHTRRPPARLRDALPRRASVCTSGPLLSASAKAAPRCRWKNRTNDLDRMCDILDAESMPPPSPRALEQTRNPPRAIALPPHSDAAASLGAISRERVRSAREA